ncbi:GTP 3',8-cyclase [Asticcacaulis endophyticus]|jgi:cyclic pyranopterin phosphate synthase|uniref:GTP 3',8-cyclase n=2 Tax=Asticcacaulis endophyticus TaxID=1395890 RepID=A0A918UQK9_9CAUL|nr:GTP 3',8-cyclase MoaA [Asticcacaulis endophyticus]GGZ26599.1 GTP 3',8-cyclase [Asticcacaulis endophyticus]
MMTFLPENTPPTPRADVHGRRISYVRISVTDRCDLRCTYCMSERQTFLPKSALLSYEELERLSLFLMDQGVKTLRITGGEPLVRKGILDFLKRIGAHVKTGRLEELTLTTNGTLLKDAVPDLVAANIKRINVSMDSLKPDVFRRITRGGDIAKVIEGIEAAQGSGIKIKLNVVVLARDNRAGISDIITWAHGRGIDVSLIETMPLGDDIAGREDQFVSLRDVVRDLSSFWSLEPLTEKTAGPARYYRVAETGGKLGLITPLSHNFCDDCNRVRVTATGKLYMCLGQDDHVDLAAALRADPTDAGLDAAYTEALSHKPRRHEFLIESGTVRGVGNRTMSVTGG